MVNYYECLQHPRKTAKQTRMLPTWSSTTVSLILFTHLALRHSTFFPHPLPNWNDTLRTGSSTKKEERLATIQAFRSWIVIMLKRWTRSKQCDGNSLRGNLNKEFYVGYKAWKPLHISEQINIKEFTASCIIKAISLCTLKSSVSS